jgi:hypothetical protein
MRGREERLILAALLVLGAAPAAAQTESSLGMPGKGHGSITFSLHQADVNRRRVPAAFGGGLAELGDVTLRTGTLEVDYGLGERWALAATIPFKSNRYVGNAPHDPSRLQNPHGERLLDDGRFHSGWGDWGLSLRWLWLEAPVVVVPFVSYYRPSHDYPIFTGTAFGTGQWRFDLGLNAGARFPGRLRNVWWQLGYAYSHVEKTRPDDAPAHRVNHSVASATLGWIATPRLGLTLGWRYRRAHDGLRMPEDFNPPFTDDLYYYHDQLFPLEQSVLSLGASWQVDDRYTLQAGYGRTLHVAFGQEIRRALTIGVTRSF